MAFLGIGAKRLTAQQLQAELRVAEDRARELETLAIVKKQTVELLGETIKAFLKEIERNVRNPSSFKAEMTFKGKIEGKLIIIQPMYIGNAHTLSDIEKELTAIKKIIIDYFNQYSREINNPKVTKRLEVLRDRIFQKMADLFEEARQETEKEKQEEGLFKKILKGLRRK